MNSYLMKKQAIIYCKSFWEAENHEKLKKTSTSNKNTNPRLKIRKKNRCEWKKNCHMNVKLTINSYLMKI